MYFIVDVVGPADNEIWYTTSDNNKLTWWALNYVPTEQIASLGGGGGDGEDVFYTPGDSGYERIYGYNVLYHDFDKARNCFVLKFDKPLTETFWKFGHPLGAEGGGVACGRNITSFILPNGVNYIMEYAFYCCSSLTSITIPNSVTSIEDSAFRYCSSLTSMTIPNSVTNIGNGAFYGCSSLTSITIPNSVTSIGGYTFDDCSSLPIENNLRYADIYLVETVDKTLSTYSIKEGTKWIGDAAFEDCSSLTSITIPNSVTSIGDFAFRRCSSLDSITFAGTVEQWSAITKGGNWNSNVPSTYVQCTNGQVTL